MFCSVPLPVFSSIQHPCLRSIVLNTSIKDCLKETVDLSSPHIVKFTPNIHAISVHTSLQCFEKGDKENKNVFSNITKIAIVKTRCNSFISCGTFDFSSVGGVCDKVESYLFTFNNTYENPFKLDKSVNPVDVEMDDLSPMMDISSLIESALSHKKHLEDAHIEFQSSIRHTVKTKVWPKICIAVFLLVSIVTICTIVFASRVCLKRVYSVVSFRRKIDYLFHLCLKKKHCQIDESSLDMHVRNSTFAQNDTCYGAIYYNKKNIDQVHPLLNKVICDNLIQHPLCSTYSMRDISPVDSKVSLNRLPLITRISVPISSPNMLSPEIIRKKPNPVPRKIYDYMREPSDLLSNHLSISSGEFFEEDHESEN